MFKKIETLFTKSTEKANKYRLKEKDRKSNNCWVDNELVGFAVNNNIYSIYSDSSIVAEYYIFNSVEVGDLISKALNTNNEIEQLLLIREIRDLSSSLGVPGKKSWIWKYFIKKRRTRKEEGYEAMRRARWVKF